MRVLDHVKAMSPERFLSLYQALEQDGFGPLDGEVAKSLRFRPQAIRKLPMAQRAKRARMLVEAGKDGNLAYELVGAYLIRTRKELVTGFLDATGVEHEEGMLQDTSRARPDPAKLDAAVAELDRRHDREDVTLYLLVCADQWPDVEAFGKLLAKR